MRLLSNLLASLIVAVATLAHPVALAAQEGTASSSSTATGAGGFEQALNAFRARHGARPLAADPELTAAAQAYAEDMVANAYFSHTGRNGENAMVRATVAGCSWRSIGENLATGYSSNADVIEGWAGSPSHRDAMLGSIYNRYGMARVGVTWVLMFSDRC